MKARLRNASMWDAEALQELAPNSDDNMERTLFTCAEQFATLAKYCILILYLTACIKHPVPKKSPNFCNIAVSL